MNWCAHPTAASSATTAAAAGRELAPGPRPARVGGAGRVPDRRGGLLGRGQHPRAAVLDRLELADRPAELVADLGVIGGGVGGPVGDAGRLGPEQDRGQAGDRAPVQPGQQPVRGHGDPVGADPRHRPGEVQAVQRR